MLNLPRNFTIVITFSIFLLTACMTKVTGTWKNSEYTGNPFTSIMVVGLTSDPTNRLKWENSMADRLRQAGMKKVVTSLSAFPDDKNINEKEILEFVTAKGIEGVLVTRLIDTKQETVYRPTTSGFYSASASYYNNFSNYYSYSTSHLYPSTQTIVLLETNLYEVKTEDLIWSMSSDTIESNSVIQLIQNVSKKVQASLKKDQLI